MTRLICVLVFAASGAAFGQQKGDVPPALVWGKAKANCPASLDWASLSGKVVVASFVEGPVSQDDIAQWNEVPSGFRAEPILFLRIINGPEALVDLALKKTEYQGCILLDHAGANWKNFKIPWFNRTVVVDQRGIVAGYSVGGPEEACVRAVLNRQADTGLFAVLPPPRHYNETFRLDSVPFYEVQITAAPQLEFRAFEHGDPDRYISRNHSLRETIPFLWDVLPTRISFPLNLDETNYDITVHIPMADRELLLKLVRQAIEDKFGLHIERETRTQRFYLLSTQHSSLQLQSARQDEAWTTGVGPGSIMASAAKMQVIAEMLEGQINAPVIDTTGRTGKYNFSASSKLLEAEAAFDMAHQLGLELTPVNQPIEVLVVNQVTPTARR